jgi:apolipoprotein N-acyltransferase
MLKVIGAGICVFGISLCWLTVPLSKGELWAVPAIILITAISGFVTLYVTTGLRKLEPTARPPIRPTIVLMLMVSVAMVLAQFK